MILQTELLRGCVCHDIFNMHAKERNKSIKEFSAFCECAVPARCDNAKRKDCVNETGMKKASSFVVVLCMQLESLLKGHDKYG